MSGIFEAAMARIEALEKQNQAIIAHLQGGGNVQAQQAAAQQAAQQQAGQFGASTAIAGVGTQLATQQGNVFGLGGAVQQPTVTADMIQQLIMPLIQNEAAKAAIISHMQAMGIQNLPDTRTDQMAELYQRFQQVAQQFGGGVAQQQVAAAPSII